MTEGSGAPRGSRHYLNIIALLIVVFVVGTFFGANASGLIGRLGFGFAQDPFAKVGLVQNLIEQYHVTENPLPVDEAVDNAIRGMLSTVDGGYTRYETAAEADAFDQSALQGVYTGIGIQSLYRTNELEVEIVFRGSPAEAAGVKVLDRIIAVDGDPVKGHTQAEINGKIRGEAGTSVTLTILRDDDPTPISLSIVRGVITTPVVDHWVVGDVGVAAMYRFTETAPGQLREAVVDLKNQGVKAIVFDLRSNGGGLLDSAREIADLFLPADQVIVRVVDRQGEEETYQTYQEQVWDGPLAVLVNGGSASASEVVSGALQDYQRATLLGTTSFGKGTVQVPYQLTDGSRVWVTQYRYLTPNSRDIHQKGLTPDVVIEQPEEAKSDLQLQSAIEYVRENLIGR